MTRKICILYTETNGLHNTDENVSKKNLFEFGRLVALNYIIGTREGNEFKVIKKVREILKPKCINFKKEAIKIHGIKQKKAEKRGVDNCVIMKNLEKDLEKVGVIVSHNLPFHIKTLQVECFRTCTYINFDKYILIDTINFFHKYEFLKLKDLSKKVLGKSYTDKKAKFNTTIIQKIFLELYNQYEKSVKVYN